MVAHLQLGLLLQQLGAPLPDKEGSRVGVYLTNALTGWNPDTKHPDLPFRELADERDRAGQVKQSQPILVILGNPPYNGYAGVTPSAEERELSDAYRTTKKAPAPQGQGLNDLYVRFFRMAERRIVEQTGKGVVCFISNYSWLDGLSFTGMRERYLEVFDKIWIDNLHGDRYRTGKLTPEGEPDPSIFSTESNREGIQVGTAIGLLVRRAQETTSPFVGYRNFWGREKLAALAHQSRVDAATFVEHNPDLSLGLALRPLASETIYFTWPGLNQILLTSCPGVQTKRDDLLVDIDRSRLESRMRAYFSPDVPDVEMAQICPSAIVTTNRDFDLTSTRRALQKRGYLPEYLVRYCYKPFDVRWIYWEPEGDLLGRKSPEFHPQVGNGNWWLEARQKQPKDVFDRGLVTRQLADNLGNGFSTFFPLQTKGDSTANGLFRSEEWRGNLTPPGRAYLGVLESASLVVFDHCVATLHGPRYRTENAGALRQDWPRIPLPASRDLLERSAALGAELRQLLDPEEPVTSAPQSGYPNRFKELGALTAAAGGQLDPSAGDLALNVGWGHAGKGGVTMPGRGRLTEHEDTVDVWLNDRAYWTNIPNPVWEYTLGGYQVIKKWLSYRERPLLGRDLTIEDARYVSEMVRRIAAILSMGRALDASYEAVKANVWEWREG